MSSKDNQYFKLSVKVTGDAGEFASIFVYDGYNEIVARSYYTLDKELKKGIYSISIELNEARVHQTIRLDKDVSLSISAPATSSAVASKNFNSSHEYYSNTAAKWSKEATIIKSMPADPKSGSLFIYFRCVDKSSKPKEHDIGQDFYILNNRKETVFELEGDAIQKDDQFGWLSFHTSLNPGQYYLLYEGETPREIPVYVFEDWQTQVFLTFADGPVFGSLKILIGDKTNGFDPEDPMVHKMDAMLQKLHNGIYYIPEHLLAELAYGKWSNPMAGLIAAHIYLNSNKKDQEVLFEEVLENLKSKILQSSEAPDIIALQMLAALHFNRPYTGPPLTEPCMFLSGMNAAIKISSFQPDAIRPKSRAEQIIIELYSDIPWTSYKPKAIKESKQTAKRTMSNRQARGYYETIGSTSVKNRDANSKWPSIPENLDSWVAGSVLNYLDVNKRNPEKLDIKVIALELQVTHSIVAEAIDGLKNYIDLADIKGTDETALQSRDFSNFDNSLISSLYKNNTYEQVKILHNSLFGSQQKPITMSSTKLIIPGSVKVNTEFESMRAYFPDMQVDSYSLGGTRAVGEPAHKVTIEKNDVVVAEFEDNIKWFYDKADFTDKLKQQQVEGRGVTSDDELEVPVHWQENNAQSRGFVTSALKLVGINVFKNVAGEKMALSIAHRIEQNNPNILYNCDANFNLSSRFDAQIQKETAASYLLLLHGTGSDTKGSFGGLNKQGGKVYKDLLKKYDGRIIAYEHKTFTQSPIQNVIELLGQLPDNVTMDLLSHSRGGLVGEILARVSAVGGSKVFTDEEMKLLKQNDEAGSLVDEVEALNKVLVKKQVKVNRFVRVACPAAGTTLVSDRMDTFLNVLFNVLSNIGGQVVGTIFEVLEALVTAVVKEKNDVTVLPGIECMRPESNFIKALNFTKTKINSDLVVIAGDAQGEGFINRIKMFLVDSFYKEDNDLVVNTSSMKKGTGRSNDFVIYDERRGNVNHFHYFVNASSQKIIYEALIGQANESRGFYRSTQIEKDKLKTVVTEGAGSRSDVKNKPVLYVLPGIMGSYLEVNSERIWLNYFRMATGDLRLLKINASDVKPMGIDGSTYKDLVDYFSNHYYVIPFAYDWRKSIFDAARELNKSIEDLLSNTEKPISFIAHSMGGLVFRAFITKHTATWQKLQQRENCRVLLLGTPNSGSYEIPRLLMGIGRSINALSTLDLANSKKTLLQQFIQYPGLLELLPAKGRDDFGDRTLWSSMQVTAKSRYPIPAIADLEIYNELQKPPYKISTWDPKIIKYIAGRDDRTPNRMEIDVENNRVNFYSTPRGDGSVTWDSIPAELLSASTYYVDAKHGKLADSASSFSGYKELLEKGETKLLKNLPPSTRGESRAELMPEIEPVTLPDEGALSKYIMGIEVTETKSRLKQLSVSITHGDMGHAKYPIIAGHFKGDGIVEAEKVLNRKLNNYLGIRHETKNYPGDIGTHEVLISKTTRPPGTILVGLGDFGTLTENQLAKTIKQGLLTYIVKHNEQHSGVNDGQGLGVSYLLIGTGFGGLSIFSTIKALLNAVNEANEFFESHSTFRYDLINRVEIIELYQHKAVQAGRIMGNLIQSSAMFSNIAFSPNIIKRASGARNEIPNEMHSDWWHRLKVYVEERKNGDTGKTRIMKFSSVTDKARNEEEQVASNINIVDSLIAQAASLTNNNRQLCETLFEMLIPNEFKGYGSDLRNIVLIVDKETARYPWEMLQDPYGGNDEPLVTRAGFLRQLSTSTYRQNVELTTTNNVLVIGNPDLSDDFPSLPAASEEARKVVELLSPRGYEVMSFIEKQAQEAIQNLYVNAYKIVHIAAHGVVNYNNTGQTGVVLGKEIIVTPSDFKQMRRVPELVFINCCSLGTINKEQEEHFQRNYEVAAGIGTQLIEMGVKAVIVAGWEVDDAAALCFSENFYIELLNGRGFGKAVQIAREITYRNFGNRNTWGAYQCYGDPYYTLREISGSTSSRKYTFCDTIEAVNKLQSLLSEIETATFREEKDAINEEIKCIIEAVGLHPEWKYESSIIELLAELNKELGNRTEAIRYYEQLLNLETANYSVRSIEQYYNIKVKQAVQDYNDGLLNGDVKDKKELIEQANISIDQIIDRLRNIGKPLTSERVNLIGSAYRRKADINIANAKAYRESLLDSASSYCEGYQLFLKTYGKSYYYPLYNWLIISVIVGRLATQKEKQKYKATIELPPIEGLQQMMQEAKNYSDELDQRKPDFWNKTSESMQFLFEMIIATKESEITGLKSRIIENHTDAWKTEGSSNKQNAIKQHAEFVINMMKENKEKLKGLKLVDKKIATLNDLMQELG